jgi:outer membrane protein assembly factor BamB
MRLNIVLVVLALFGSASSFAAGSRDQELWDAAGRGDAATVRRLLAEGADVNAKTRYGATALFFAADKAHLDVVSLLLERGADPNVKDSFYGFTPLFWAVERGAVEVALLLVQKGANEPANALELAIKQKDARLGRAILERGPLDAAARALNRARAAEAKAEEIVALLDTAATKPEPPVPLPPDRLQTYVASYRNEEAKATVDLALENGALVARAEGQAPLALVPIGENRFRGPEGKEAWLEFGGRGGTIEYVRVQRGGTESYFGRAQTPAAANSVPAASTATAPSVNGASLAPAAAVGRAAPMSWPSFRGPGASGIGDGQGAPTAWDLPAGKNVRWRTDVPGIANSSPVVWGDRVFVSTAVSGKADHTLRTGLYGDVDSVNDDSSHAYRLYALDRKTGRMLWERTAEERVPPVKRHLKSTQANPTPATDGKRVVVLFGSGGLYAYDLDGRPIWKRDLGTLDSGWFYDKTYQWGFGSSPVIVGDRVIVQADIQKGSFLAAYELADGREAWRTPREEIPTWGTPTLVRSDTGDELVTNGTTVRGYDARTGALRWSLKPNSEVTVATPVVGEGLVFVTAGYPPVRPIYAIRPGSRGDLTLPEGKSASDAIAWSSSNDGTYIPTPLVYRGHLYTLGNNGRLSCYDARTGALRYRARVGPGSGFSASPVAADGRLYLTGEDGDVFVVKAGPQFELLGTNKIGEVTMATPAISDGLMVFRTLKQVVAVGE